MAHQGVHCRTQPVTPPFGQGNSGNVLQQNIRLAWSEIPLYNPFSHVRLPAAHLGRLSALVGIDPLRLYPAAVARHSARASQRPPNLGSYAFKYL